MIGGEAILVMVLKVPFLPPDDRSHPYLATVPDDGHVDPLPLQHFFATTLIQTNHFSKFF